MTNTDYPIRINKYLALHNYSTRIGGDDLIKRKLVKINGKFAQLGDKVNEQDKVEVLAQKKAVKHVYFAYNKPRGIVTHSAQKDEKEIKEISSLKGVFPVGRLDKNSHGLIILTNDGRVTDRLLNPDSYHEKEYLVRVADKLRASFEKTMEDGVDLGDYVTRKCQVKIIDDFTFKIILTEGKKHQIKRMCDALHNDVRDLKRTRVMNIKLNNLHEGGYRPINGKELDTLLKNLGLKN